MTQLKLNLLDQIILDLRADRPVPYAVEAFDKLTLLDRTDLEGCVLIPLTQGQFTIVEEADYHLVKDHKWFAVRDASREVHEQRSYYARAKIKGKSVSMHRLLMGLPAERVDHRDCDGLNNRRHNLRLVSSSQSTQNRRGWKRRKDGSDFKGVYARRNRKGEVTGWAALIKCEKVAYPLGVFPDQISAAKAYDTKAKELHGEYARLNFE